MIQLFKSLLGDTSRDQRNDKLASRPAVSTRPKPTQANIDYRAVSLAPNSGCDLASRDVATGKRYLLREAPRLPMAGCPTPAELYLQIPQACRSPRRRPAAARNGGNQSLVRRRGASQPRRPQIQGK